MALSVSWHGIGRRPFRRAVVSWLSFSLRRAPCQRAWMTRSAQQFVHDGAARGLVLDIKVGGVFTIVFSL